MFDICTECAKHWPNEIKTIGQLLPITCGLCKQANQKGAGMVGDEPCMVYETLLRRLHEEMKNGRSEEEIASQLRDAMDDPWWNLTDDQMKNMELLSVQLYEQDGM